MADGTRLPRVTARARWAWLALGVGVIVCGVVWASAPLRRREILFEAPFRVVPGASLTGAFQPERRGPFALELRFREAWLETLSEEPRGGRVALEALGKDIGGGWHGDVGRPPGFAASYSVRSGDGPVLSGATGDRLEGFYGPREVGVGLAWIQDGRPSPHEFHVRIDRAVEGLGTWEASFVVAAAGDEIRYARAEVAARACIAAVVVPVALLGLCLLHARFGRVRPRGPSPTEGPP